MYVFCYWKKTHATSKPLMVLMSGPPRMLHQKYSHWLYHSTGIMKRCNCQPSKQSLAGPRLVIHRLQTWDTHKNMMSTLSQKRKRAKHRNRTKMRKPAAFFRWKASAFCIVSSHHNFVYHVLYFLSVSLQSLVIYSSGSLNLVADGPPQNGWWVPWMSGSSRTKFESTNLSA